MTEIEGDAFDGGTINGPGIICELAESNNDHDRRRIGFLYCYDKQVTSKAPVLE